MRILLLTGAAALALIACQKAPPPASATASATGAGASAGVTGASSGAPHRRAGLWEQTITKDGQKVGFGGMRMCLDEAALDKAAGAANTGLGKQAQSDCSQHSASRGLDGVYRFSSTCAFPEGGTSVTTGQASGDFSTSYQVKIDTTISGSKYAAANGHHASEVDGHWLGPCPAGMAPGDVQLANGLKFNGHRLPGMARGAVPGGE
jgi:hypothetical protein